MVKEWVQIPTGWIINTKLLHNFRWQNQDNEKSSYIAALILYIVIAQHVNHEQMKILNGKYLVRLSFKDFEEKTALSRKKISEGINILVKNKLIEKNQQEKTNKYLINDYKINVRDGGWAKLPYKHLDNVRPFVSFTLRQKNELNALKLYLLLIALRNIKTNYVKVSYDKIPTYTGIDRKDIRSAISLLINLHMIHVDKDKDKNQSEHNNNIYRIKGIDSNHHRGNTSQGNK